VGQVVDGDVVPVPKKKCRPPPHAQKGARSGEKHGGLDFENASQRTLKWASHIFPRRREAQDRRAGDLFLESYSSHVRIEIRSMARVRLIAVKKCLGSEKPCHRRKAPPRSMGPSLTLVE